MRLAISTCVSLLLVGCGQTPEPVHEGRQEVKAMTRISGEAQGTTYTVLYISDQGVSKREIDEKLRELDRSLSTYIPTSVISQFNAGNITLDSAATDAYFREMFTQSYDLFGVTSGAFDPTVNRVVKYWGWGPGEKFKRNDFDSTIVDSLLQYVGMNKYRSRASIFFSDNVIENTELEGDNIVMEMDFNAIAQGYSVDVLADFLNERKISNYLVEIGGEVRAKGYKFGKPWTVGIDQPIPLEEGRKLQGVVELQNAALATSGNYRKVYEIDGKKYPHTINPKTGFPVQHNLLSASVIASACSKADALATAFMVVGVEQTKEWVTNGKFGNIQVYLIYDNEGTLETWKSEGFEIIDPPTQQQ